VATTGLSIVVSGMIAADPCQGGATWAVLQYILGLKQLGHDVTFIEPLKKAALRPEAAPLSESRNGVYFREVMQDFGLVESAALLLADTSETLGPDYRQLLQITRRADVLLNISGMLEDPELIGRIPVRVYIDLDPAFNQLWQAAQGIDMRFSAHNRFVTVGQAIGQDGCAVPTCGVAWIPTLQPVVLRHWPPANAIIDDAFTTVGHWRAYGSIEHQGVFYGQKAHSLRRFMELPGMTSAKFMLALAIHLDETNDLALLHSNSWGLLDPGQVAGTPQSYREFIQGSRAEFGLAKSGYVVSRCGWFSDRSACYLASGRPVLAQDTGFGRFLPAGTGLLAFDTVDEALAGIEAIRTSYDVHARAARTLAEEYFDSDRVLNRLLQSIGATADV
jgi:hypothetical protein